MGFRTDSKGKVCNSSQSSGYSANGYNVDIECSKHYSGKIFTNTKMINGVGATLSLANNTLIGVREDMPTPSGDLYPIGTGHVGSGVAIIRLVNN